jgi:hypothetical protein
MSRCSVVTFELRKESWLDRKVIGRLLVQRGWTLLSSTESGECLFGSLALKMVTLLSQRHRLIEFVPDKFQCNTVNFTSWLVWPNPAVCGFSSRNGLSTDPVRLGDMIIGS